MRTALLTATTLAALTSLAVAQTQPAATTPSAGETKSINPGGAVDPAISKRRAIDWSDPNSGRLHYDMPCRVSSAGKCLTEPPPYPSYRARP